MTHQIKSSDIKPGDIIKFEYGDYGNWVTAVIDEVSIDSKDSNSYYPLKLIWHYLSDEPKEEGAPKDCRAEKLGNNPAPAPSPASSPKPYPQFICYGNLNAIVEKLN